uniref:Aspartyl protease family A01B putative n=1 Tax=Albugo laibachii Nc14 TaxID=890382 RepID=F0WTZ6_9STRA|nr:aspartyl protease family A01B putative [Albugo laibachii Nc14]|eukprot:CCA24840.1 aspartyl protease family A01B putative [Albugo laibachii Nc14]
MLHIVLLIDWLLDSRSSQHEGSSVIGSISCAILCQPYTLLQIRTALLLKNAMYLGLLECLQLLHIGLIIADASILVAQNANTIVARKLKGAGEALSGKHNENDKMVIFNRVSLGIGYGTYYIDLYIGIPLQKASLLLDTTSQHTVFPCKNCVACADHMDPYYDIAKSQTSNFTKCGAENVCNSCEDEKCRVEQSYSDGSFWSGLVVEDLVWVASPKTGDIEMTSGIIRNFGFPMRFACETSEDGIFSQQRENGILGLDRSNHSILNFMVQAKRIDHRIFSYCLHDTGGTFVLGGFDSMHHTSDMIYTRIVANQNDSLHGVYLKDIQINNRSIGIDEKQYNSGRGMVIASSSVESFFPSVAGEAFRKVFKSITGFDFEQEANMIFDKKTKQALPTITLVFAGIDEEHDIKLTIPASSYLIPSDNDRFFAGIQFTERTGGVFGSRILSDYNVIFDLDKDVIGFAHATCAKYDTSSSNKGKVTTNHQQATLKALAMLGKEGHPNVTPSKFQMIIVSVICIGLGVFAWKRVSKSSWLLLSDTEAVESEPNSLDAKKTIHRESERAVISPGGTLHDEATSLTSSKEAARTEGAPTPRFVIGEIEDDEI